MTLSSAPEVPLPEESLTSAQSALSAPEAEAANSPSTAARAGQLMDEGLAARLVEVQGAHGELPEKAA